MKLPFQITFNALLMILIGFALMAFGGWLAIRQGSRIHGVGFFATGIGNILFGITNGFTNMTPTGRLIYRLALVAYLVGLPLIAYYLLTELF
jgi:hypothetical protein